MNFQILTIFILASASVSAFLSPETVRRNLLGSRQLPLNATPKTEKGQRKPWEFLRFVSQSSKFVPSPFQSKPPPRVVQPGDILWIPESPSNEFTFAPLDDVVMGGASASNFDNASGIWRGFVTDANNGGFVGIRNTPYVQWDMRSKKCRGLELKLRSKGKPGRFKVGIRDSVDFNGIVWNASVDVQTKPTTVRVPLDKLKPTMFARVVEEQESQGIQKDNIVGLQLVYSKFEYDGGLNAKFEIGDVDVQIMEIRAY